MGTVCGFCRDREDSDPAAFVLTDPDPESRPAGSVDGYVCDFSPSGLGGGSVMAVLSDDRDDGAPGFTPARHSMTPRDVVGDLGGVDCLLGLDFQMAVGAHIDLGDMTISISRVIAQLRDCPGREIYPVYSEKTAT